MQQKLTHGGDWAGFEAEYGRPPLDFSANVSPLDVPWAVRRAVAKAARQAARYPDPLCRRLTEALALHEKVEQKQILCGNGAADLIFRVVLAKKPRTALVTAPTFAEYGQALETVGLPGEAAHAHRRKRLCRHAHDSGGNHSGAGYAVSV